MWLKPLCNACACVAFDKSVVVFRAGLPLQGAGEVHGVRRHVENTATEIAVGGGQRQAS